MPLIRFRSSGAACHPPGVASRPRLAPASVLVSALVRAGVSTGARPAWPGWHRVSPERRPGWGSWRRQRRDRRRPARWPRRAADRRTGGCRPPRAPSRSPSGCRHRQDSAVCTPARPAFRPEAGSDHAQKQKPANQCVPRRPGEQQDQEHPAMPAAIQQFPLHSAFFMVTCLSACVSRPLSPIQTRRFRTSQAKASSPEPRSRRCA